MEEETAGAPAYLLIASGALNLLYSIGYGLWTLLPILMFTFASISNVVDGTSTAGEALGGWVMINIVPLLQILGFFITGAMALLTMAAGVRFIRYRSKGLVWLGTLAAPGGPFVGLFVNAASAFNLGALGLGCITGCLLGNIPTALVFLIGVVAGILAAININSAEPNQWS